MQNYEIKNLKSPFQKAIQEEMRMRDYGIGTEKLSYIGLNLIAKLKWGKNVLVSV